MHWLMFLARKALAFSAFLVVAAMWSDHERFFEMVRPKYFALLTASSSWPWMVYDGFSVVLFSVTLMAWHLSGLNSIFQFRSQVWSLSRSF